MTPPPLKKLQDCERAESMTSDLKLVINLSFGHFEFCLFTGRFTSNLAGLDWLRNCE